MIGVSSFLTVFWLLLEEVVCRWVNGFGNLSELSIVYDFSSASLMKPAIDCFASAVTLFG